MPHSKTSLFNFFFTISSYRNTRLFFATGRGQSIAQCSATGRIQWGICCFAGRWSKSLHGAAPIQVANLGAYKNVYVPIQLPGSAGGWWVDGNRWGHLLKGRSFTCAKLKACFVSRIHSCRWPVLSWGQKENLSKSRLGKLEFLKNLRFT